MKKLCNKKYLTKKISALWTFFWSILLQTTQLLIIETINIKNNNFIKYYPMPIQVPKFWVIYKNSSHCHSPVYMSILFFPLVIDILKNLEEKEKRDRHKNDQLRPILHIIQKIN